MKSIRYMSFMSGPITPPVDKPPIRREIPKPTRQESEEGNDRQSISH